MTPPKQKMLLTRPEWDDIIKELSGSYIACNCGHTLTNVEQLLDHWQSGHFDYVKPDKLTIEVQKLNDRLHKLEQEVKWIKQHMPEPDMRYME